MQMQHVEPLVKTHRVSKAHQRVAEQAPAHEARETEHRQTPACHPAVARHVVAHAASARRGGYRGVIVWLS